MIERLHRKENHALMNTWWPLPGDPQKHGAEPEENRGLAYMQVASTI